jgi:hypothetical protein
MRPNRSRVQCKKFGESLCTNSGAINTTNCRTTEMAEVSARFTHALMTKIGVARFDKDRVRSTAQQTIKTRHITSDIGQHLSCGLCVCKRIGYEGTKTNWANVTRK